VVLTQSGFQKLRTAQSKSDIWNSYTKACTLEALSEQTGLSTHTLSKVHGRNTGVDLRTLVRYFSAFDLTLETNDYTLPVSSETPGEPEPTVPSSEKKSLVAEFDRPTVSWGAAPDVSKFYGRTAELATLQTWILEDHCRLITLSGMGGIGKTWLSVRLLEQVQAAFEVVIWRSLQPISNSQPLSFDDLLGDVLECLVPQSSSRFPNSVHHQVLQLIDCLQNQRCLIVIDNVESILPRINSKNSAGERIIHSTKLASEGYEQLFQLVGQGRHQSCLVLTSREEPSKIQPFSGAHEPIRLFRLNGLKTSEIKQLFKTKGHFQGSAHEWDRLVTYYDGNPFILGAVATTIHRWFGGSISEFLMLNTLLFDDICELMNQQLGQLSDSEIAVMEVLARQDHPCSLSQLRSHLPPSISPTVMLSSLKSLEARSLLEQASTGIAFPSLPSNYVQDYVRNYVS
jgi:hypothetical protein